MNAFPIAVGGAEKERIARTHQERDIIVHIADLLEQQARMAHVLVAQFGMGRGVIAEQMPARRHFGQHVGMGLRHLADDEECRLYARRIQRIEHFDRVFVRAVVEGQGHDMGAAQSVAGNRLLLEKSETLRRGFIRKLI